jgi:hypothetical protein
MQDGRAVAPRPWLRTSVCGGGAADTAGARGLLDWATKNQLSVRWGKRSGAGSFRLYLEHGDTSHALFRVYAYAKLSLWFQFYQSRPPLDSEEKRRELLDRLNAIEGVSIAEDDISRKPSTPMAVLTDGSRLRQFLEVFDWFESEVRRT